MNFSLQILFFLLAIFNQQIYFIKEDFNFEFLNFLAMLFCRKIETFQPFQMFSTGSLTVIETKSAPITD